MKLKRITSFLLALAMLLCLAGCKEKEEKSKSKRPDMDALRAAEVGSYIYFGEYEQDGNEATGKEAIEWLVLDKQEDKMLVISRYGLDCQPYNLKLMAVTWETCSLRGWLNDDLYETAFIPEEKKVVLSSVVTADANPLYDTPAGNDTMDYVFLLSIAEANRYFADNNARACVGTPYCHEQRLLDEPELGTCNWWLRSPGINIYTAAYVKHDGSVYGSGNFVYSEDGAVRPALWINLNP